MMHGPYNVKKKGGRGNTSPRYWLPSLLSIKYSNVGVDTYYELYFIICILLSAFVG